MSRFLLTFCLILISCGQASPTIELQRNTQAMALGNDMPVTVDIDPDAQVGQPFNLTFTVIPNQNVRNVTFVFTIPPTVTVLSGFTNQPNLKLLGGQSYIIPLELQINDLSHPLEFGLGARGYHSNDDSAQGGYSFYFINQNDRIITAQSLPYHQEFLPIGIPLTMTVTNPYPVNPYPMAPTSISLPKPRVRR